MSDLKKKKSQKKQNINPKVMRKGLNDSDHEFCIMFLPIAGSSMLQKNSMLLSYINITAF